MESDVSVKQNATSLQPSSMTILGVRVHRVSIQGTLSLLNEMVFSGRCHQVIPINPEMIMIAQKNKAFKDTINSASLILPDGTGILIASWIMGKPITQRVTGVDTTLQLASLGQRQGFRLYLLGAAIGVAERAAHRLQNEFPGLKIAGTYAGSPHADEEEEIRIRIREAAPHILLVAYGAPTQELWVARNLQALDVPVTMCVGGTFDFLAGVVRRAPRIFQWLGLEWFYRLLREPNRWRRMLALPKFAAAVILNRINRLSL